MLAAGEGPTPTVTDTVLVHYEGRLADGTVFDSSYQRGQPAVFGVADVIPGWTEGLQLMRPGGKARFTIPPELGYGARGAGGVIPPNAVLVFDVELLAIAPKQ
jgi:FKBP-type peptidyl-prolyl cis-trans isomerase FkpA/FKBP-type peptidyl-prolyl cis-trans isomerase FklB